MTSKMLNVAAHGRFQDNPHKLLQAVLKNSNNHMVNPYMLGLRDTSIYLCPKNDEEDRYEIKAFFHTKRLYLALTVLVSKSIQEGLVRWEAPPEVKIIGRGQRTTGGNPAMEQAEEAARAAALEYWKWGEKPSGDLFMLPTEGLCHFKRDYLVEYFNRVTD